MRGPGKRIEAALQQLQHLAEQGVGTLEACRVVDLHYNTARKRLPPEVFEKLQANGEAIRRQKIAAHGTQLWADAPLEDRVLRGQLSQQGISREGQARIATSNRARQTPEYRAAHSAKVKAANQARPAEEKARIFANISEGVKLGVREGRVKPPGWHRHMHTLPSGRVLLSDSSWEDHTADLLESFVGDAFARGPKIDLGDGTSWFPDFIVLEDFLLEVKGHPLAWKRWETIILPKLRAMEFSMPVLMLGLDPLGKVSTFDELIYAGQWL